MTVGLTDTPPGHTGVVATARVAAVARAEGTRVHTLHNQPPLVLRRSAPDTVRLVSVGGGPVAGDRLRIEVDVGPGARLVVYQVAAMVALPAPMPTDPSRLDVVISVAAGGWLRWWGEPLVAAAGCDHHASSRVTLAPGARLSWREELVAGRFGEDSGRAMSHLEVRRDRAPIVVTTSSVGDRRWASTGGAGGARVVGSRLEVGPPHELKPFATPAPLDMVAACHRPTDDSALLSAVAQEHPSVRTYLNAL